MFLILVARGTPVQMHTVLIYLHSGYNTYNSFIDLCERLENLDLITETLSIHNKQLRTFSCWKSHSLTTLGIKYLSKCTELRELDLGWCLVVEDPGDCLAHIAHGCPHLTKLILSGWRGLADYQLLPIVRNCRRIKQLDLLGTRGITAEFCSLALRKWPFMKHFDVSFCDGICSNQVIAFCCRYLHLKRFSVIMNTICNCFQRCLIKF